MKKLILTIAISLILCATTYAQNKGGLFQRGDVPAETSGGPNRDGYPILPEAHNQNGNHDADVPLGSGVIALLGMGAAYALAKKKKEER